MTVYKQPLEDLKEDKPEDEIFENNYDDLTFNDTKMHSGVSVLAIEIILCILIVVAFVVIKQVKPEIFKNFNEFFSSQLDKSYKVSPEISDVISKIKDIFNV